MSVTGTPKKPPRPNVIIIALLVLILAVVLYIAFNVNEIKNIERGKINTAVDQVR